MADYVIPPKAAIVKCRDCKTLYVPNRSKDRHWVGRGFSSFEKCPTCGYEDNNYRNTIPLWKYNIIKWFRGGFNGNKGDQRSDPEQCERTGSCEGPGSER